MSARGELAFGDLLKQWRKRRGRTQFDLAHHAGFSQRHLSFLESGRSKPSRATVVVLAEALEVPVVARNALLLSAGFAPLYSAEPLDSGRLQFALAALNVVLESHRPFPALIVDRAWNLHGANPNAMHLLQRFLPAAEPASQGRPLNVMRLCVERTGLRDCIRNWLPFMAALLAQLKVEHARLPTADLQGLIDAIESDHEFRVGGRDAAGSVATPVLTLELERDGFAIELFTLLSTFGTATDANLAELRVETFFPANAASRERLVEIDAALGKTETPATTRAN